MPYVPVENTVQVECRCLWAAQQVEVGLYYLRPGGWGLEHMALLAESLIISWDTHVKPVCATTCSLTEIYLTDLETEFSSTLSYAEGLPIAGSAGTESLPNNNTCALSFGTPGRGRSFRGRIYPVGITEGHVTGNIVSQTWMDAWIAWLEAVDNLIIDITAVQTVVSRISNKQPRVAGLSTPVTSRSFKDNVIDTQRRRLPGRGS